MRDPNEDGALPPIRTLHSSDWQTGDQGMREARYHVGQSSAGFHYYVELSYRGGGLGFTQPHGQVAWSAAHESVVTVTEKAQARAARWLYVEVAHVDSETQ